MTDPRPGPGRAGPGQGRGPAPRPAPGAGHRAGPRRPAAGGGHLAARHRAGVRDRALDRAGHPRGAGLPVPGAGIEVGGADVPGPKHALVGRQHRQGCGDRQLSNRPATVCRTPPSDVSLRRTRFGGALQSGANQVAGGSKTGGHRSGSARRLPTPVSQAVRHRRHPSLARKVRLTRVVRGATAYRRLLVLIRFPTSRARGFWCGGAG